MVDLSHVSSAARLTVRREVAMLPRLLKADEQVVDLCHGAAAGKTVVLVVTTRRLISLTRRRFWGAKVESVPLSRIRRAEEQIGVRHASVVVDAGGRVIELTDVDRALAQAFCARVRLLVTRFVS